MRHINLIATVLRDTPKGVGTFAVDEKQSQAVAEYLADQAQARHLAQHIAEGRTPEHVRYERQYVDTELFDVGGTQPIKSKDGFAKKGSK